jgi:phosphoserine phosphatase RsbU/P
MCLPVKNLNLILKVFWMFKMKNLNFGLLVSDMEGQYQKEINNGVQCFVNTKNIHLTIYEGKLPEVRCIDKPVFFSKVYNHISLKILDGIIITSTLANYISKENFICFFNSVKNFPVISLGMEISGIPSLMIDNFGGICDIVNHIINKHEKKKIAYLSGPSSNPEAERRLGAYKESLKNHSIPFCEDLVVYGAFTKESSKKAIAILLDERHVYFDAIVVANDDMALGAMEEFNKRGIEVPNAMIVTGFDNIKDGINSKPPLTTISQPIVLQAYKAGELLYDIVQGKQIPNVSFMNTELLIRKSCGCQ